MSLLARNLAGQRLNEANERVEANLSPAEVALWRRERGRFKGTPHQRFERFRDWMHDHPEALREQLAERGEARAKALVRERSSAAAVAVPCRDPYRFRTYAACNPVGRKQPKWTRSTLLRAGRSVEVPCAEPHRYRVKELCVPRKRKDAWVAPWEMEEPAHAFEGLI